MALRKDKQKNTVEEKAATEYYRLKTDAVDDLVNANEENSPEVSEEELKKYHQSKSKFHLPDWLKVVLVKAWFYGSVCFFILWGLGTVISSTLDLMAVTAVAMGIVTNLLTNNALRFLAKTSDGYDRYIMFPSHLTVMLLCDVLYACVIMFLTYLTYDRINAAYMVITGKTDTIALGVGPILFGFFCTAYDMLFVAIRNTVKNMIKDAKASVAAESGKKEK